jgi:hypothetical protein
MRVIKGFAHFSDVRLSRGRGRREAKTKRRKKINIISSKEYRSIPQGEQKRNGRFCERE